MGGGRVSLRLLGPERPPPSGSLSTTPTATALPDFGVGRFVAPKARGPFSRPLPTRAPPSTGTNKGQLRPNKGQAFRSSSPPLASSPPPSAGVSISPVAQAGSGSGHLPGVGCPRGVRLSRGPKCPLLPRPRRDCELPRSLGPAGCPRGCGCPDRGWWKEPPLSTAPAPPGLLQLSRRGGGRPKGA